MKINQILDSINNNVCGGSEYLWKINKDQDLRYVDFETNTGEDIGSFLVDSSGEVYQITVEFNNGNGCYRWTNEEFKIASEQIAILNNIDDQIAWENVRYTEIKTEAEILQKVKEIVTKVAVCQDLPSQNNNIDITESKNVNQNAFENDVDFMENAKLAAILNISYKDLIKALTQHKEKLCPLNINENIIVETCKIAAEQDKVFSELLEEILTNYIKNNRKKPRYSTFNR